MSSQTVWQRVPHGYVPNTYLRGSLPMKGIPLANTKDNSDGEYKGRIISGAHNIYLLARTKRNQEKKKEDDCCALVIVCAPVVGLRGPSCCRSPWPPYRLISPIGPPLRTRSRGYFFLAVGSRPPPSRKTECPTHLRFSSENKNYRTG